MTATAPVQRSRAARIGNGLLSLVVVVVILGCSVWLLPAVFGYERYVITGGSMSGSFEKGSVAFEEKVPVEELRVGDVITYQPPPDSGTSSLVTHRIVSIRLGEDGRPLLRTKGDANDSIDPWKFSLAGSSQPVVRHTVPYVGYAFIALADRELRMLLIGAPAAVIGLLALRDLVLALRRPRTATASAGPVATVPAQLPRRLTPERTPV